MPQLTTIPLIQTLQISPAVLGYSVVSGFGRGIEVGVFEGDVTKINSDVFVAPHPRNHPYLSGINAAMIASGSRARLSFESYAGYVEKQRQEDGGQKEYDSFMKFEKGARNFMHVVCGSIPENSETSFFKTNKFAVFTQVFWCFRRSWAKGIKARCVSSNWI